MSKEKNALLAAIAALGTCTVDSDAVGADGGMSFDEAAVYKAILQCTEALRVTPVTPVETFFLVFATKEDADKAFGASAASTYIEPVCVPVLRAK
jgi:hypothetical protein